MKTKNNLRKVTVLFIALIIGIFSSNIIAQTNQTKKLSTSQIIETVFPNITNSQIGDSSTPDLLRIILLGGVSQIDTSIIKGQLVDDSTLIYRTENCRDTLNFKIKYIKNGEIVDKWNLLVDSAIVRYSIHGIFISSTMNRTRKQTASEFLIYGLLPTSNIMTVQSVDLTYYGSIGYRLALIHHNHLPGFDTIIWDKFSELNINKSDLGIISGVGTILIEAGLVDPIYGTWIGFRKQQNTVQSNKFTQIITDSINVEFIGNHQIKLIRDGEESIVNYNNLDFLFP